MNRMELEGAEKMPQPHLACLLSVPCGVGLLPWAPSSGQNALPSADACRGFPTLRDTRSSPSARL